MEVAIDEGNGDGQVEGKQSDGVDAAVESSIIRPSVVRGRGAGRLLVIGRSFGRLILVLGFLLRSDEERLMQREHHSPSSQNYFLI